MTHIEIEAEWIKQQKKNISNRVGKLVSKLVYYNLEINDSRKYNIEFDCGTCGNRISMRVYHNNDTDHDSIEHTEFWCLDSIFDFYHLSYYRTVIEKKIDELMLKIKEMEDLFKKYSN